MKKSKNKEPLVQVIENALNLGQFINTAIKVLLKSVVVLGYTDQRTESKHSMTTLCSHMWS